MDLPPFNFTESLLALLCTRQGEQTFLVYLLSTIHYILLACPLLFVSMLVGIFSLGDWMAPMEGNRLRSLIFIQFRLVIIKSHQYLMASPGYRKLAMLVLCLMDR